ncbi:chloride channel 3/4/5 [Entomortierella parvispora]|uniref:Chloride channel 3/4/5 n=1 Tax=Entomortierella parvispora TaxID=205924 RepID=A0A9P3LXA5_9FUNG|nr:chloride channel 3/4/5 [Entomortierella parvispora]
MSSSKDDASGSPSSQSQSLPQSHPSLDRVQSPPNQPRRSLSTQLAPDYHDWVNDVSSSRPTSSESASNGPPPTSSTTTNRFLDAVSGRSKAQQGRARRENQPSFSGSAFTNSDREDNADDDDRVNNNANNHSDPSPDQSTMHSSKDSTQNSSPALSADKTCPAPASKLPALDQSRVAVSDPSRPAYKLGAPIVPKPRPLQIPRSPQDLMGSDQPTETSALLGSQNSLRKPQGEERVRWTNEGSRRGTARYNGIDDETDGADDLSEGDSLRRPSRARSMSPTLESRRGGHQNRGRVAFRNYENGDHANSSRRRNKTLQSLRRSSLANINMVKEKFLSRRSGFYDDAKEALVKENNGIRIWYHNYTTIDWIHDFVKERVRLRHLRSLGGIRGMLRNKADGLKGWVLVLLTGVITACLAAFIDVSSWWLGDLRMGYCTTSFWWSQYFCCWESSSAEPTCPEWVSWSQALSSSDEILGVSRYTFDWIVYCCFGTIFAFICVVMVTSDGTVSQQKSHGATKRRSGPNYGDMPNSSSRNSMESILVASQPKKIAYFGAGSGIPEVKTILGGFVIRGFLGFRTLMIKLIGLPLMVASGLNMGKQGPLVHIACCVGNIVCRIFDKYNRNDGKRREILSAAAASGVAVAFGAPIGGVLFSLEEVSYYFPSKTMWRTYFCALISAVVLKMINPYRVGKTVLFQVTYDRDWHLFESLPFFFISVFGGVYGAIFSQFHMSYSRFRSRTWIGRHPVQEVLAVTVLTCAIQWINPWTRVNLLQLLTNLYSECTPENNLQGMCAVEVDHIYPIFLLLAQVFLIKVFLNFLTFGVKVPGGIFIPTMVAGAVFGRMVGLGMQWIIVKYPDNQLFEVCEGESMDCIIPGLYALIGAAACLAGVTRMTVSLVVIMFELTGAMTYSLPIMMAVMMGKFVGDAFSPDAFFNKLIDLNEHPYLDNKKDYNTFGTAADIADRYLETIDVNAVNNVESLRRKVEILAASGYSDGGLPIVDHGILVGYIASNELGHALNLAEQKHPDCICIFRNRASSNTPATEIITSLDGFGTNENGHSIDSVHGTGNGGYGINDLTTSPIEQEGPYRRRGGAPQQQPFRIPDFSEDVAQSRVNGVDYDNDMLGYGRPIRDSADVESRYAGSRDSLNRILRSDSKKSFKSDNGTLHRGYSGSMTGDDGASELSYTDGTRRFTHIDARVSSSGTTDLLRDPAHTMDFTPFTDQAPLSVSLFSSMDLVMELFIKLGIKYVCVVKAGEHYGMIHKKRLLTFLKENDQKQKLKARRPWFWK